ncbi:hypothetical protein A9R00_09790 [Oleispira antarctica]|uniref:Peptidase M48 domain-containing protein n=1 Tax=Oleispira antarctica TaxID=188908 RepID=A0A1Y5HU10_OLEAN|nr:hypothetical protein A9R00_09790 [Oleispira antarctica]
MFANFAAKRHLTGPLRAVSPVAENDNEIDWKSASKAASSLTANKEDVLLSDNSLKLNAYFNKIFKEKAAPEKTTIKESIELVYVEAVSLLIPMVYIGSILAAFSGLIWLFVEPMLRHFNQGQILMGTAWTCLALVSFAILFLFMRPLFGGFRSYHGRTLQFEDAPALMELVEKLSEHLGVIPPKRIEINNETTVRVDAYAGINSIYRDEYKIILGAPLLMSLSLTQLVGLLAHELAHFQNKQQKIAFYLMHHVSEWLYFRATGQDKRHELLLKRMQKQKLSLNEFVELWVWQRIHLLQQNMFAGLFSLHRSLTAWKCREIELEADKRAVKVVGSQGFSSMIEKVRDVQGAQAKVSAQNHWAWKEGFLLDDYALAVAMEAKNNKVEKAHLLEKEVTRFCPSDKVRLEHAMALSCKGSLPARASASLLLEQAKEISCELTLLDYESSGIKDSHLVVVPSEKIRQLKNRQDKLEVITKRYFDGRAGTRILKFEPSCERDIAQFDIQTSIDFLRRNRVEDGRQQAISKNLFERIYKAYVIERLLLAKLPVEKYLGEEAGTRKDSGKYLLKMRKQYRSALLPIEALDQVFYQRAHEAMRVMGAKSRAEVTTAFQNLELFAQLRVQVVQLHEAFAPLNIIVNGLVQGVNAKALQAGAVEKQNVWTLVEELKRGMQERPIFVGLSRKKLHLVSYLDVKLGVMPNESVDMTIEDMASYTDELLRLLQFQYHKWQAQLALVMTRFEQSNKIEPINLLH